MESSARSVHKAKKTLKLITALLAKAESTPFPAEAQTFQEHAERLMVRYGIEQATIDAEAGKAGKPREAMVEERFELSGQYRVGQALGYTTIAHAFTTVRVLQSTTRTHKILFLIGAESDVQQVLRLFTSLQHQLTSALQAWWLNYPLKAFLSAHEKTLERRQFQLGFLTTVAGRITNLYGKESHTAALGNELVLSGRKERADDHVKFLHPEVRSARSQAIAYGSSQAHAAGSQAGAQATVNSELPESG